MAPSFSDLCSTVFEGIQRLYNLRLVKALRKRLQLVVNALEFRNQLAHCFYHTQPQAIFQTGVGRGSLQVEQAGGHLCRRTEIERYRDYNSLEYSRLV